MPKRKRSSPDFARIIAMFNRARSVIMDWTALQVAKTVSVPHPKMIDPLTAQAVEAFLEVASSHFPVREGILFGSRALGHARIDSDADVAILLRGARGEFMQTKLQLADIAFDTMLDTGIRIQPLPIWDAEWSNPESWSNPELLRNVKKSGISVWHASPS